MTEFVNGLALIIVWFALTVAIFYGLRGISRLFGRDW